MNQEHIYRLTGDMRNTFQGGLCLGIRPPTPEQRLKFVTLANSSRFTISVQFAISRKCSYKWLVRFAESGAKALSMAAAHLIVIFSVQMWTFYALFIRADEWRRLGAWFNRFIQRLMVRKAQVKT